MKLFHASPYKFDHFNLDHFGEGEGHCQKSLGFGLYLSEEFKVAKRAARYFKSKLGYANIYTATLQASKDQILDLTKHWQRTVEHPRWGHIDYPTMLCDLGEQGAFEGLLNMGIKAVRDYEADDGGLILLCVQPQYLRIVSCETLDSR
jgi:hypothetical protein